MAECLSNSRTQHYPVQNTEQVFARTNHTKYANYFGDGSGRDTYVVLNNGGLASNEKSHMLRRPFKNTYSASKYA